jgi:hypothetical protein
MTPPPEVQLTVSRNWLFGGYTAEVNIMQSLATSQLPSLVEKVSSALKPHLTQRNARNELKDIKGREPHEAPLLSAAPAPSGEELLLISGKIATEPRDDDFNWEPFQFSCHTQFERFEDPRSIIHRAITSKTDSIPQWLPWWMLGSAAPIKLEHFRLGLEFFTSRFVLTRLSFTPIVSETLLIEADQNRLAIKLRTERPYWKPCNPFGNIAILRKISEALTEILGVSLEGEFVRELGRVF